MDIRILAKQDKKIREIARTMGISRHTVRRYLRSKTWQRHKKRPERPWSEATDYRRNRLFPFSETQATLFFQVIAKRYESGSIILTSILSFGEWEQAFGGNTVLTSATLDIHLHHVHVVQIHGDINRLKDKRKPGIIGQQIPVMQTEE